jgi:hypothetical protein
VAYIADAGIAVSGGELTRAGIRQNDLDALVADGRLERTVRKEYDRQPGQHPQFGGSAVMIRHRAYYRVVIVAAEPIRTPSMIDAVR